MKVKILLHSVNEIGYLQTITIGPKFDKTIRILKNRADFYEPLLLKDELDNPNHGGQDLYADVRAIKFMNIWKKWFLSS